MFAAQIARKLTRREEEMEDLLTSNVFGLWRYLAPQVGLIQFLATSQRPDGGRLGVPDDARIEDMTFWPWLHEEGAKGAEPDVLIKLLSSDQKTRLFLIEAKYLSEKSSLATEDGLPNDQLAREMDNLRKIARKERISDFAVIYITAHTVMPIWDIEESVSELASKTGDGSADRFYWTTWRRLATILIEVLKSCGEPALAMLRDLHSILCQLGLVFFENVQYQPWTLGTTPWEFKRVKPSFIWQEIESIHYRFQVQDVRFVWALDFDNTQIQWRWSK